MAKGPKNNTQKKKKAGKKIAKSPKSRQRGMPGSQESMQNYFRMLADPCNSRMVSAPYAGFGSSLLVRTVQTVTPSTPGSATAVDFIVEAAPFNYPSVFRGIVVTAGDNTTYGNVGLPAGATFLGNLAVREFRPVAACLKWIPTGPISGRSGAIGMAYSPSMTLPINGLISASSAAALNTRVASNGTEQHECLWLPSFADERFTTVSETDIAGCGTVRACGTRVDATVSGANSVANGYIELTAVYEWTPTSNSTSGSGMVPEATPPSPFSLNQVLSRIKDVGKFVFQHAGSMIEIYENGFAPRMAGSNMRVGYY